MPATVSMITRSLGRAHSDQRGVVALEFLFNSLIFFTFIMAGFMQWRVASTDILAYGEAHRRAFTQSTTFFDAQINIEVNLGPFQPAPNELGGFFTRARAAIHSADNPGVLSTNRGLARGVGSAYTQLWYGPKFTENEIVQDPDYDVHREAYTVRPPWTWGSYPGVFTQEPFREGPNVRSWFEGVRDADPYTDWVDLNKLRGDF